MQKYPLKFEFHIKIKSTETYLASDNVNITETDKISYMTP
eukprot:UN12108